MSLSDQPPVLAAPFVGWMIETALPFWTEAGWWPDRDCFHEKLDFDGVPLTDTPLRVRTQARQIYVYAHAHVLGWGDSQLEKARRAMDSLRQRAWAADGKAGWAHVLNPQGHVANPLRDTYDHAFVLHALAWMHKATGDAVYLDWADETLAYLDGYMAAENGGWLEDDAGSLPRRQNPHMHGFEAMLALYECTGQERFLARAEGLYQLFERWFYDPSIPAVREFFDADWAIAAGAQGNTVEPGHMAEWVWLLGRYARNGGKPDAAVAPALLDSAIKIGVDAPSGFLVDGFRVDIGRQLSTRRLWVQTEYLKGLVAQGRRAEVNRLAGRLLGSYLADAPPGAWCDRYRDEGARDVDHMPASTLYHLFGAAVEAALADNAKSKT